jgi:ferric-dicitrate binding protein FerR (iron transport regulator)
MKQENIKITPQWKKSKDSLWKDSFEDIVEKEEIIKKRTITFGKCIVAAVIAILFTVFSTVYFYQVTETAERGHHQAVILPDGSTVNLNAESRLTYKPYWWYVSREIKLKGEVFFEVKEGKRFSVNSDRYRVNVLGTSFNVYSRENKYSVTCMTGKVEVGIKKETNILTPDMKITYNGDSPLIEKDIIPEQSTAWLNGKMVFIGVPLTEVITEIERQYDINIKTDAGLDYLYTGNFSMTKNPEEILDIISRPFGIKFRIE